MPNHKTKQNAEKENHFTDEQTVRRIHEHLMNEHDRISEADIKNVKTDYRDTKENGNENISLPETDEVMTDETKDDNTTIKDNSDPDIETPWNILGS